MKRTIFIVVLALAAVVNAQQPATVTLQADEHGHQYASLREASFEVKDFSFPTLDGGKLNLREAARGKRLLLVHYFASWCHNSNFETVVINELFNKYKDQGLGVVAVAEYSTPEDLREFVKRHKPDYPICYEGDGKKKGDRTNSTHYKYRKKIDDERLWGTTLNLVIKAEDVTEDGEVVAKRLRIAPGELIKAEVEEFIRQQLAGKN